MVEKRRLVRSKVLYIDLETTLKGLGKDVGALFNGLELHENNLEKLKT
jgi:ATP-dependent DNA helicase RecQ